MRVFLAGLVHVKDMLSLVVMFRGFRLGDQDGDTTIFCEDSTEGVTPSHVLEHTVHVAQNDKPVILPQGKHQQSKMDDMESIDQFWCRPFKDVPIR